jgi:hypothetical protein
MSVDSNGAIVQGGSKEGLKMVDPGEGTTNALCSDHQNVLRGQLYAPFLMVGVGAVIVWGVLSAGHGRGQSM